MFNSCSEVTALIASSDLGVSLQASILMTVPNIKFYQGHNWPVTEECDHHIITPNKECPKCKKSALGWKATSFVDGLLSQKFRPTSGLVKQRRKSTALHKKRVTSSNLPVITVKSYQKLGLEPGPARPKTCVPQYKLSVCDVIQLPIGLMNLTGWWIYSWLCTVV